jgi:DNA-binding beta-propeller fold protein YncE
MRVPFAKSSLVGLIMLVVGMAFVCSASAKEVHVLSGHLGGGELSLTEQSGVAVDQMTGEVYVADTGNDRIAKYGTAGEALGVLAAVTTPTFLAVDSSAGSSNRDVYVVEQGTVVAKFDPAGDPVTTWGTAGRMEGFGQIAGIAVDPSGNLFVMETPGPDSVLHQFGGDGAETTECTVPPNPAAALQSTAASLHGLAVDARDDLFYTSEAGAENNFGIEINPSCKLLPAAPYEVLKFYADGKGIAVDESNDNLFTAEAPRGTEPVRVYSTPVSGGGESPLESVGVRPGQGLDAPGQLAVRSAGHVAYVAETSSDDIAVLTMVNVEPPHVQIEPPTLITGTTAHFRAEINPEAPVGNPSAWDVKYRFQCVPACSGQDLEGSVEASSLSAPVEATAENLLPGTDYKVFITAGNAGGTARSPEAPADDPPFQTDAIPPTISEEAAREVSETAADIDALLNPGGTQASYWVQYVTKAQFESSAFAGALQTAEQFVDAAQGVPVSIPLAGLSPSSAYVARVVATNTVDGLPETAIGGPVAFVTRPALLPFGACPNGAFRIGPSALLPDCRAYEQASPVNKGGGGVEALPGSIQAPGSAGDAITFFSQAGIPGGVGAQDYPTFLATRGTGSWDTQGLLPPQSLGEKAAYLGLTPDGHYAVTEATLAGHGTGVFLRDLATGEVTTVVPYNSGCGGNEECFSLAGAVDGGSKIFLETRLALAAEPPTTMGAQNVYVWDQESGEMNQVDLNERGEALPEGGFAGPYAWANHDLSKGGTRFHLYVAALDAVSEDGDHIVFTERGDNGKREGAQLYVRIGLDGPSPRTVKVSAYQAGREGPELPAAFLGATPEGRFIFFKSEAELTSDAYSGEGTESLYRYDTASGKLIDLTSEAKQKFAAGPGVEGMLGSSGSGRVAYFVAKAALTASRPGPGGKTAEPGQANLFRWEEGATPPLSFVTTLENGGPNQYGTSDYGDWSPSAVDLASQASPAARTARVSSDGQAVVFSSHRALTGAPNMARGCDSSGTTSLAPCAEFFRYSAADGTLDCVSCNPTGERPLNNATLGTGFINAADFTNVLPSIALPRNLSADGDRFFFQTPDSLVGSDVNGGPGCAAAAEQKERCLDVYEWEAAGTPEGSCEQVEIDGGCLYLISSGDGDKPSYFGDVDPEGKNVFIFTASRLTPSDKDQLYDVYDASEDGGLASQHEVPPPRCSSLGACQGPVAGAESGATPGSSTLSGGGNPKAKSCKKGFVRKHGKCVKKARRKTKHGKAKRHKNGHKPTAHKKKQTGRKRGGKK